MSPAGYFVERDRRERKRQGKRKEGEGGKQNLGQVFRDSLNNNVKAVLTPLSSSSSSSSS